MTSDAGGGLYYGRVKAISDRELMTTEPITERAMKRVADWTGAGVFVLDGKGKGQFARISAVHGNVVTLEKALNPPPDSTSTVTMTMLQENYIFVGNQFEDVGVGIQYYGTSINHIAANNLFVRSSGIFSSGRWYQHYQPSWYCQFIDNEIRDGNVYRGGPNGATFSGEALLFLGGVQKPPNAAPLLFGEVVRRNRLLGNAHIEILGGQDASAAGVSDVLVEGNVVEGSREGIKLDRGVKGIRMRDNHVRLYQQ